MTSWLSLLVLAWAPSTLRVAAATSCAESRWQLASAVASVESIEARLEEARQLVFAKELEVGMCESRVATTAKPWRRGELRSARLPPAHFPCIGLDRDTWKSRLGYT